MIGGDWLDSAVTRLRRGTLGGHYRAVFDSHSGRVVLTDVCRKGLVMQQMEGLSAEDMKYAAGKRDLALYVLDRLRIKPQDLQQISEMEVVDD